MVLAAAAVIVLGLIGSATWLWHRTDVQPLTLQRVTISDSRLLHATLSPDGRLVAYLSDGGRESASLQVWVQQVGSPTGIQITHEDAEAVAFPSFSPDSTRVLYTRGSDDCNGRPAGWMRNGRHLLLERFGGPRISVAVIDTETGDQVDLLRSEQHSVSRPRVSPDGRWIAFEAGRAGSEPAAFVARMHDLSPIPTSNWIEIDRDGLMPAWSPDGRLLYFVAGTTSPSHTIRARRFDPVTGRPAGESFDVLPLEERIVTQFLNRGVALVAAPDRIFITLASFTGDVWLTTLAAGSPGASTSS